MDHYTYSWEAARPALSRLRERKIPVVLCSSKTAAEMRPLVKRLCLHSPYIVENGGGIRIPRRFLPRPPAVCRILAGEYAIDLGTPYRTIIENIRDWRRRFRFRGFSEMSAVEIARACGLSLQEARRAKKREYDEPIILEETRPDRVKDFLRKVREAGLLCHRGGRFLHITGHHDKGRAMEIVADLCLQKWPRIVSVALGDSPVDLPMLQAADIPILIPGPDGKPDGSLVRALRNKRIAPFPGPDGWNRAILEWLNSIQTEN